VKLIGIMPVRNEDWILGFSLRVALKWCDQVIVADHGCSDSSRTIMQGLGRDGVIVRDDREDGWREMEQRQMLLAAARDYGATHVAIIDADEVLTANLVPLIRDYVERTPQGQMLDLPLYNLREIHMTHKDYAGHYWDRGPAPYYHSNGVWGARWVATAFQDRPELHWAGDQFHHREPFGTTWRRSKPIQQGEGGVLHFWGASEWRLRAKHALYKITERLRFPKKTAKEIDDYYNQAIIPQLPWQFKAVKPEWIEPYADLMQYLHIDREPWHEAECKRLYRDHGEQTFHGLDLFGVV
jgi:hypothetical protein